MAEDQQYPLHECVFSGDLRKLSALLRSDNDIAKKDKHGRLYSSVEIFNFMYSVFTMIYLFTGNTALHLAVMLGKKGN